MLTKLKNYHSEEDVDHLPLPFSPSQVVGPGAERVNCSSPRKCVTSIIVNI